MGKSIRSKVKRKWRSRKHAMANKPFQDKLQREADWRLQKSLKKSLKASRGSTLSKLASALSGEQMDFEDDPREEGEVEACGEGILKTNEHRTGYHTRSKKPRHGIPDAKPEQSRVMEEREKGFAFIERTWELEKPKADDEILPPSELVPEHLKSREDDGDEDEGVEDFINNVRHKDMNILRPNKAPRGKNKKRAAKMKSRKRMKKCNPY
jgi:hypothetical protein